jgi:hypothetical protein
VIGVRHLQPPAEALELAADHPHLALGQHLGQVIRMGVEEHQGDLAAVVEAGDPVGLARVARRQVRAHAQSQGRDPVRLRLGDLRRVAAVDHPAGQVPAEVDHLGPGQGLDRRGAARPDAGQAGDRSEEGKQNLGAQGFFLRHPLTDGT